MISVAPSRISIGNWSERKIWSDPLNHPALWTVEHIFPTTKSILQTRPIHHRRNETIRGHVFCSFLALLLKAELERRMKFADLEHEWAQVLRGLEALHRCSRSKPLLSKSAFCCAVC
jgi:hypothetical protein